MRLLNNNKIVYCEKVWKNVWEIKENVRLEKTTWIIITQKYIRGSMFHYLIKKKGKLFHALPKKM